MALFTQDVKVRALSRAPLAPLLRVDTTPIEPIETSRSWYQRWYVWAGVGAIVAGGIVAGAVIASKRNNAPDVPNSTFGNMSFFGGH